MQKIINFIKVSWQELQKVTWPDKKEIFASTLIVIIVTLFLMIYIGLVDFILSKAVKIIFK
jgi:preprotein translocase subunit SecE